MKGKVINQTKQPIEFIQISLLKNGQQVVGQTVTDSLGFFSLSADDGRYLINGDLFQSELFRKEIILNQDTDIGVIQINDAVQLDGVTLAGKKKLIEKKIDRLIFNVENSTSITGGNALDALRITPRLKVQNDQISMIGKNGMMVMVNDRLLSLSGEDLANFLKTLNAEDLKRIEVIANPPAKYVAAGNSGIINIVLKSKKTDGFSGRVSGSFTQSRYASGTVSSGIDYKNNRFTLSSSVSTGDGASGPILSNTIYFPDETWKSRMSRKDVYRYLNGRFGLEYELSKKSILGVQYLLSLSKWNIDAEEQTIISKSQTDNTLFTKSYSKSLSGSHSLNGYYRYLLDDYGKELNIDADYLSYNNNWDRSFTTQSSAPTVSQDNSSDVGINSYSLKSDLKLPYTFGTFETGGKVSFISNNSSTLFTPLNISDISQNNFIYKENIQAAYLSFSKNIGERIKLKAGIRLENTQISSLTEESGEKEKTSYTKVFPSLYFTYQVDKEGNNVLGINYSRRIGRPNYTHLNPLRWYSNPYVYTEGNPLLRPSFTDNIEFSHTYGNLISTLFVTIVKSGFGQVTFTPQNSNLQITRSENYYNSTRYGWSESYSFKPLSFWESFNQAYLYYSDGNAIIDGINPQQKGFGAYVSSNNKFLINKRKTIAAEVNYWYQFPESFGLRSGNGYSQMDVGMSMKLLKEKLNITVNLADVFGTAKPKLTSYSNQIKQVYANYFDLQKFRIGQSYNFGGGKIKAKKRGTGNEEEKKRIENKMRLASGSKSGLTDLKKDA
ncbi:outer membrane beta-barrel family protein [Elizabethkingia anophelis]|uniref:outer membrane beta-barrel family protein n=1 Tax=Elizabethkingia anophelis TaxID=1117645 RepID=UPI0021A79203|nr:outer membrane beta-barrel family protein [Elizabethkingia anophelis]